jgi:predicted nucleic-acid-binding protein
VDTNVLLRTIVEDEGQAKKAVKLLDTADMVAVSLCELVWVLRSAYKVAAPDIAEAILAVLNTRNVVANRPAAEAGLAVLDAGGDFADGVIPWDGRWLGGETFFSFDKKGCVPTGETGPSRQTALRTR